MSTRVWVAMVLVVMALVGTSGGGIVEAVGSADLADPNTGISCTIKFAEDLGYPGPLDGDGVINGIGVRCYLNNDSGSGAIHVKVNEAIDKIRGEDPLISAQFYAWNGSRSSLQCLSTSLISLEHGPLVTSEDVSYPPSSGGTGMHTNYVEALFDCPYQYTFASNYSVMTMTRSPFGSFLTEQKDVNNVATTGDSLVDEFELVRDGDPASFWEPSQAPGHYANSLPPVEGCEATEFGLQVDGQAILDADHYVIDALQTGVIGVLAFEGVDYPAGDVSVMKWRLSPSDPWQDLNVLDQITVVGGSAVTFKIGTFVPRPYAGFELWCELAGASNDPWYYSAEEEIFGGSGWSQLPRLNRACYSLVVFRLDEPFGAGDVVSIPYRLDDGPFTLEEEGVQELAIDSAGWEEAVASVESYSSTDVQTGGLAPAWPYQVAAGSGTIRFTAVEDGNVNWLTLRCTDVIGDHTVQGSGDLPDHDGGTVGSAAAASCWAGIDMELTSPSTWLRGFATMAGCVVQDFFVPSSGEMASRLDRIDKLREQAPLQWVDSGVGFIAAMSFSFDQWSLAGPDCVDVMGTQICPRDWDDPGAMPAWVVAVVGVGLWSTVVFAVWKWF